MNTITLNGHEVVFTGEPDLKRLSTLVDGPGDLWHSGLTSGTRGLLDELVYANPTWWYLNDPDVSHSGISWRVDGHAFAARRGLWEHLSGFDDRYESAIAQGLDLGYRSLKAGAVPLNVPGLFSPRSPKSRSEDLPPTDVWTFLCRHLGGKYLTYVVVREAIRGGRSIRECRHLYRALRKTNEVKPPLITRFPGRPLRPLMSDSARVSVVLPTFGRQHLASQFLADLARQTVRPHEVLVVDATPAADRTPTVYDKAVKELPVTVIYSEGACACIQRNEALRNITGDYILFGEDDTRIPPEYIEFHLRLLQTYRADASNGTCIYHQRVLGEHEAPEKVIATSNPCLTSVRVDEKFATGLSCVRTQWLNEVRHDLNFQHGYGEDTDIGMRLYRAGGVVLANPFAVALHYKAVSGGFRAIGSSDPGRRRYAARLGVRIWAAPQPTPTVLYYVLKHFTKEQAHEWLLQYVIRTLWPTYGKNRERLRRRLGLLIPRLCGVPRLLVKIDSCNKLAKALLARPQQ